MASRAREVSVSPALSAIGPLARARTPVIMTSTANALNKTGRAAGSQLAR